jgi:hypothetical protein
MGAWGFLPFENDDALDWLHELEEGGADVVRGALEKTRATMSRRPTAVSPLQPQRSRRPPRATLLVTCPKTWLPG